MPFPPPLQATFTRGVASFSALRDMMLSIREQRRVRGECISEAQHVWEDSYLNSYNHHREMLSSAAYAQEIARKDSSARDPYLTYLTVLAWQLNFFLAYNHRLLAAHMVRKRWVRDDCDF